MRKIKALGVLLATVMISVPAAVSAADKIAVFDLGTAIMASKPAQERIKAALERPDIVALKAKVEGLTADLQALGKEGEAKRLTWSKEQSTEHQKKIEYARADYELATRKLQAEQQQIQQAIVQEFQPKTVKALEEVIKEEGVTLVFRKEAVVYATPPSDITAKVVDVLNKTALQ